MQKTAGSSRWEERLMALGPWLAIALVLLAAVPGVFTMPPLDRDETMLAQGTFQMLRDGHWLDIRYLDGALAKKPIGMFWLQAISVSLFSSAEAKEIWAYRLPNLSAACLAAYLVFALGRRLFDPRVATLAAALVAASLLLQLEALIAKTDAILFAALCAAYLGLHEAWHKKAAARSAWLLLFWLAFAFAVLVKGPVAPLVLGLTILALCFFDRSLRLILWLKPLWGLPLFLAIAAPWYVYVLLDDRADFVSGALSQDWGRKLIEAQEGHGFFPGFYGIGHWLFFLPGAFVALPAVIDAWRQRKEIPAIRFCFALLLPTWIFFEIAPTKLPHYVLPTYPALAFLTAWAVIGEQEYLKRRWVAWMQSGLLLGALVVAGGYVALPFWLEVGFVWQAIPLALVISLGMAWAWWLCRRARIKAALLLGCFVSAAYFALLTGTYLPQLKTVFTAERLWEKWEELAPPNAPPFATSGFREPSIVFVSKHEPVFPGPYDIGDYLAEYPRAVVAVVEENMSFFEEDMKARGLVPLELGSVRSFYFTTMRWANFRFFTLAAP